MFRLPALLCYKLLYILTPSPTSSEQFPRAPWDAVSWAWSPKIFPLNKTRSTFRLQTHFLNRYLPPNFLKPVSIKVFTSATPQTTPLVKTARSLLMTSPMVSSRSPSPEWFGPIGCSLLSLNLDPKPSWLSPSHSPQLTGSPLSQPLNIGTTQGLSPRSLSLCITFLLISPDLITLNTTHMSWLHIYISSLDRSWIPAHIARLPATSTGYPMHVKPAYPKPNSVLTPQPHSTQTLIQLQLPLCSLMAIHFLQLLRPKPQHQTWFLFFSHQYPHCRELLLGLPSEYIQTPATSHLFGGHHPGGSSHPLSWMTSHWSISTLTS